MAASGKIKVAAGIAAAAGLAAAAFTKRAHVRHAAVRAKDKINGIARRNGTPDDVEERSLESFPASDAPGYGPGIM